MNVTVKSFDVAMEVKTSGIELEVRSPDGETHLGDLVITKTKLIWCEGRIRRENGVEITWEAFRKYMNGS